MKEARLIVPMQNNHGQSLSQLALQVQKRLAETFGGFTLTEGYGGWISPTGKVHYEPVLVFDIAMDSKVSNIEALTSIAAKVAKEAEQEAVYVRLPGGSVHFVTAEQASAAA